MYIYVYIYSFLVFPKPLTGAMLLSGIYLSISISISISICVCMYIDIYNRARRACYSGTPVELTHT